MGAPPIIVRHPRFDFDGLARDWLAGNRLATHFGNAGHVFIPLGEQFFIDTVKEFRDSVVDDDQRRAINAFIGQESTHKRAHEAIWTSLVDQGVPVDSYEKFITAVRSLEEVIPATFRLSVTAALEHYTAAFGHAFLTEDLAAAVPDEMARLLAWHGLEELEHRAVAFDVLQTVNGSYLLRFGGFVFATGLLVVVPGVGVAVFASAHRGETATWMGGEQPAPSATPLRSMSWRLLRRMTGHLADYLRPGFHPHDMDVPPEAETWAGRL